jgi:signal transduction histidine kinase/ligand-binding sensor domain-containing protein
MLCDDAGFGAAGKVYFALPVHRLSRDQELRTRVMRRLLLLWAIALLSAPRLEATDLRDVITDSTITTWNEKDGLPSATIWALAQDPEGYLWIGSREGLLRFDGVRFTRWETFSQDPLPKASVRALLAAKSGALWVGFGSGGQIARVVDGRATLYTGDNGLGTGIVTAIAEDRAGTIWASSEGGVFAFDGTRWSRWGEGGGVPDGAAFSTFSDRAGRVYAALGAGIFIRTPGSDRFERVARFSDSVGSFAEAPDGTVWVTDPTVGYRSLKPGSRDPIARQGRGLRMLVDRRDNLWIGTGGQGLWRTRNASTSAASLERSSSLTGLLGDGIYSLLEDRDGNLWAGTTEGLNRLTPRTIKQVIDLGLVRGIGMEPDGRVWIGTVDKLFTFAGGADGRRSAVPIPADTRAMAIDDSGLWVAAESGVFRIDRDRRSARIHWPGEGHAGQVDSILLDRQGGMWLITATQGIVHWRGREARRLALPDPVRDAHVTAAFVASNRRAWFGFNNGRIAVVTGDQRVTLLPGADERGPVYRTIFEDEAQRLWFGGDGVLSLFDHDRLVTLRTSARFPVQSITAIVTDERGSLWLGTPIGVIHLERDEFDRAVADPRVVPWYSVYNRSDGIAGTPLAVGLNRGAIRTLDGQLWFVTTRGITVLDPHALDARSAPLSVRFEGALVDDRRFAPGAEMRLPAGASKLEIDYTAVNLTAPLKTRFRYRLDPFDHDWVEAGPRRQAFYTNLGPGQYAFRVIAADATGGSSTRESVWRLSVAPMFYQTRTFAVFAALAVGVAVLTGWRLRERQLRHQFSILLSERARLGREIHDTLLQGLVAIALQFDSLAYDLAPTPHLQGRFLRLRDRVEEYIREARRSIWDLHTQPRHRSLVESLRRAGEFATDGRPIAFTLQVQGTPCPCPPRLEEQVVRIAQEAALNAVRHADPHLLRIDLMYDDDSLTLKVADDGRGFDSGEAGGAGHYGITSMQERTRSVGGALTLVSTPGRGTEVIAVLPLAS